MDNAGIWEALIITAYPKLVKEKFYATWRREFKAIATAQGLADVLDITIDPSKIDPPERELDETKNQAMYPVFQRTLQTNATKSIVLKQESTKCSSRKTWERLISYFQKSIQHQNTKAKMKQMIHDHKAHLWKNLLTSFIYWFDELVTNYNDIADTSENFQDIKNEDLLRQSILGFLLNVEILDKSHQGVHGHKMSCEEYHEHVLEICQPVDISRQENKISSDRISKTHERED